MSLFKWQDVSSKAGQWMDTLFQQANGLFIQETAVT